jgi:hypothetical protein
MHWLHSENRMATQFSKSARLVEALMKTPPALVKGFKVTRKGCGRGSGDAPRALKTVILSRLLQALDADISSEGGDLYSVLIDASRHSIPNTVPITFRVTTARRLQETGRPWFNVSSDEVRAWTDQGRKILVAQCLRRGGSCEVHCFVLEPEQFGQIEAHNVKKSESVPTALFESNGI